MAGERIAMEAGQAERHMLYEDVLAILLGTLFVALGVVIYTEAVLLFGGIAGLALLLQYATGASFWSVFVVVNLPFFVLALKRMGWQFAVRSFLAVILVALFSHLTTSWVDFSRLDPVYAAVIGGALTGMGMLMLFRHHTGLGAINILAIHFQEKWRIRAGYFQLAVDLTILLAAFFFLTPDHLLLSVVGTTILNLILAINHKPGRYLGLT